MTRSRATNLLPSWSLTVDESGPPTMLLTSSQEEVGVPTSSNTASQAPPDDRPVGKRRRPKYSLTTAMLKKHPIMKFSATGPIDRNKNPQKWWCWVCKVELSLMSRGSLELLSHYKSESHLIKEHRIRMEIPGMALYDKDGTEILGISLNEARKKATDTYPIVPQRDACRPLVGQDSVPNFSSDISPTDRILSQISILEHDLRHGGHIKSLTAIYDELSQLTSGTHFCSQNWSPQRLFVSIVLLLVGLFTLTRNTTLFGHLRCLNQVHPVNQSVHRILHRFLWFTGNSCTHVPGTHRLLRYCYRFFRILFSGSSAFNHDDIC